MSTTCANLQSKAGKENEQMITLDEYEPDLGAPFKVVLVKSVQQKKSASGEVIETRIPNFGGLLKEVALARALCDRKFSAAEIKFVRKAIGLKANELSHLLGISAEHLSRCENGDRALSIAAEKLFRVVVLKKRFDYASLRERLMKLLEEGGKDSARVTQAKDLLSRYDRCVSDLERAVFDADIEAVHDVREVLSFQFEHRLPSPCHANENNSQDGDDDDDWKQAA